MRSSAETWGQLYRPAGLANVEARSYLYPWVRVEAQVWGGKPDPNLPNPTGDVVVLALQALDPTGHLSLHAGRFVLSTGAVRPVHIDGGHVTARLTQGTSFEAFGGVPVVLGFGDRSYDWLVGGRAAQRLGNLGILGASYVERRDHGREVNEELGADMVLYLSRKLSMNGRTAYDLISRGFSEAILTSSYGSSERRVEVYGSLRNASLIIPATSLFSVLSDAASVQAGTSGRIRVAPRLRLEGLVAYRGQGDEHGLRARMGGTLWLNDEGDSSLEVALTRDGVGDGQWTGLRTLLVRELIENLRLLCELELVVPDHPTGKGNVWPWGRLSARYTLRERWVFAAGAEGSSSAQFNKLIQALVRVAYQFEVGTP